MSKTLLIASGWLLTAAGTFALGWTLRSGDAASDKAAVSMTPTSTALTAKRTLGEVGKARKQQTEEAAFLAEYLIGGTVSPENMRTAMKAVVDHLIDQ